MNSLDSFNIAKKENQLVIAFCGPSTCGKSTVIKELLKEYSNQSNLISSIKLDTFFYNTDELPKIELRGKLIPTKDLKQSIDWDNFYRFISQVDTPVIFIDGFITFADKRSFNLIDICILFEYNLDKDFDIALERRVRRKEYFKNAEIPKNYLQDPFGNPLNYRCAYFHDIVWAEMVKHPEYRKPENWERPIMTLSATNDLQRNVQESKNFIHPYINSHIKF